MGSSSGARKIGTVLKVVFINFAILVTALVCIELLAFAYYLVPRLLPESRDTAAEEALQAPSDAYPDKSWLADYYREQRELDTQWSPYTYWRRKPFAGNYIKVDERGFRATWNQPVAEGEPRRKQVWLFGGSSMWGTGARDDYTIPSSLSKILAENFSGIFTVTNMGETGYVNTQEVITLLKEMQRGNVPDVVIFYDGFNDTYALLQSGQEGMPQNEWNRANEFNILNPSRSADLALEALKRTNTYTLIREIQQRFLPVRAAAPSPRPGAEEQRPLVGRLINAYLTNMDTVGGLAIRRGFQYRFLWQASLYSKSVQSEYEKNLESLMGSAPAFIRMVNSEIESASVLAGHPGFRNMADLFGSHSGTVFMDGVHTSESGNEMIARKIFENSRDLFAQAAATAGR